MTPSSSISRSKENISSTSSDDVIIAVMGRVASGKTSFIKLATGNNQIEIARNAWDTTRKVQGFRCQHPSYRGRSVIFIDTPGIDDIKMDDTDVLQAIADWVARTYKKGTALDGLLILHPITLNRMHKDPLKNIPMFERLCGVNYPQKIILVTTKWSEVDQATGIAREEALKRKHWNLMLKHGACTFRFEHSHQSAWMIVSHFAVVPGPLEIYINQLDGLRAKSQVKHLGHEEEKLIFPNLDAFVNRPSTARGISATIQTLRDAQCIANIYRLPSFKDAVSMGLALAETIKATKNAKQPHINLVTTAGQLIVEIADTIHNRTVPEGTELVEMIQDLILELEEIERLLTTEGSRRRQIRQYILQLLLSRV